MKKILGVAVLLVVALVAIAFFVIRSQFPPEKVQAEVKGFLSETLKREASIGSVSPSLWPLGLSISDVKIANHSGEGFSKDPLFHLGSINVKIDLLALMTFQVRIKEIELDEMSVVYEILADGTNSLDGLGGDKKDSVATTETKPLNLDSLSLPASFQLDRFSIKNAKVSFRDLAKGTEVILGNINQSVSLSLDNDLRDIQTQGELLIQEVTLKDKASGVRTGSIRLALNHDLKINLKEQKLTITSIQAGFQEAKIEVMGTVATFLQTPEIDLKVKSNEIQIADFYKEIPRSISPEVAKAKVSGFAKFEVSAKGSLAEQPQIKGALALANIKLAHSDVPAQIQNLGGSIAFSNDLLAIDSFHLDLDKHPVDLSVKITALQTKPILEKLALQAKFDLEKLMTLAQKLAPVPEMSLKGMITASLKGSGELDPKAPEKLKIQGNVLLEDILFASPDLPDEAKISGDVFLDNNTIKQKLKVDLGPSNIQVNTYIQDYLALALPKMAKGKQTKVSLRVASNNLELDRLMPPASTEATEEVPASPPAQVNPEIPANINLDAQINLKRTVFRHLTLSNFAMNVKVADQVITESLKANLYDGSISQSMKGTFKDVKNAIIDLRLQTKGVQANDLISNGNNNLVGNSALEKNMRDLDNTVYGKMDLDMNLKTFGVPATFVNNAAGTISSALLDGRIAESSFLKSYNDGVSQIPGMGKMKMKELAFRKFSSEYEIKDGKLIIKELDLEDSPIGFLSMQGPIGFDGSLNLSLKNILTSNLSKPILSGQDKASGAVTGALKSATGLSMSLKAIPSTTKGEAITYYSVTGTLDHPKFTADLARMQEEAMKENKASVAAPVAQAKEQVRKKVAEAKAVARQEVKKVTEKAKKEVKKQETKAKSILKKESKKVFKKFGF